MGLQQFEHRLERLVEGAFAKAFRGELQPVEVGRRLTREMDLHRAVSARGIIAPNHFVITMSPADFDRFSSFGDTVTRELTDVARERARSEAYKFLGPVELTLAASDRLSNSLYTIEADVAESEAGNAGAIVLGDGRRILIGQQPITIGRVPSNDIPINDPNVSRNHAELRRDGDAVYLFDRGSTNGTRVNGTRIQQHLLADGEIITIGVTSMRYEAEG